MKAAVNQSSYGDESPEEVARMKANLEKLRRGEEIDEIYNRLKEDGFGLGPKGLDTNDDLDEIEGKPKMTSDAQAVINIIEKQPMLVQKLALVNSREELEGIFDYLITKLNPQLAKNPTGVRTAVNNTLQKVANIDKELNEDNLQVKSIAKNIYSVLTKNGVNAKLVASIPSAGPSGKSIGATLTGGSNEALVYYFDDVKTKLTTIEIHLRGEEESVLNFEKDVLSSFPGLEQYDRQAFPAQGVFSLVFRVREKTTAKGGIQELDEDKMDKEELKQAQIEKAYDQLEKMKKNTKLFSKDDIKKAEARIEKLEDELDALADKSVNEAFDEWTVRRWQHYAGIK
jgi:hypothetical protein